MSSSGSTISTERWGQYPVRCATGWAHLYLCPHCDRIFLRDPDAPTRRADALPIRRSEEDQYLASFRATRSKLPRMHCLISSTVTGTFSVVEEFHDCHTDALIGFAARYEQVEGRSIQFELRREDHRGDVLLTPVEHTHALRRLLCWIASHPLPSMGKISAHSCQRLLDEVINIEHLPAPQCVRLDAVFEQRYEALYRLQPHPLWDIPLHLTVVGREEIGSDPTVVTVFAQVQSVIPALLRRHCTNR